MLKQLISGISLLLWTFMFFQSVFGQQNLNFTTLTTKNGLSSNTVNVILQDHNGLIWFGTNDGLNKFDGTNFTIYTHKEGDSTSIAANDVVSLLEDRSGKLWVGTNGGGLVYYDPRYNSFISYCDKTSEKKKLISASVLYEDYSGNIWVGGYGKLRIINKRLEKIIEVDIKHFLTDHTKPLVVLSLFEDNKQRMWIGTNSGLLLFDHKHNKFIRFVHRDIDSASISGDNITSITQDSIGHLFFATNHGLNMLLPDEKSFQVFQHSDREPTSISSNLIYSIAKAPEGKLWLGTEEGLNIFDINKFTSEEIKPDLRKCFGLTSKSVRSISIAKKGIIWLGTYQGGINKYDPNLALFNLKRSTPFDPNGLSSRVVTSFAEFKKEGIFIGTDGGGLNFFNRKSGLFNHCNIKSKIDLSANALSILAIELDLNKKLWIGTYQNGLFIYDPLTGKYKQYLAGKTTHNLSQNDIFFVKQDSKGLVWIGTNGEGVDVFDPKTQNFTRYSNSPHEKRDLRLPLNGFMRAVAEDKTGNIWLGSAGTGIAVFNPGSRTFTLYNKLNSGLSDDAVLSIYHDRSGNTWVGTDGGGLNFFNNKTKKFNHITEAHGLPNGIIYKILEDKAGAIWISTDKGISSIDPNSKKIKNFDRANGVQDSPFVLGSGMIASNGELYFGGQEGFNYFLPSELPKNDIVPSVLLTELKVANNLVTPGKNSAIGEQIGVAKDVDLSYGQNFSISYISLNYTAPQQNNYSYKLKGFDHDWNYVAKEKIAYYTNLDPGNYVFQVKASNNQGVWSTVATTVKIHVHPPIWRTVYAYLLYVLTLLGLIIYMRYIGIRKIKKELMLEQEKLSAQILAEQERREAEQIHELDIQKIKFLTNLSHEFRTPISLIMAPADKLLVATQDHLVAGQVKMIQRNARRLLNLVNQLLNFQKTEEKELKLNISQGDLIAFIKEAAESFQDLSDRKKIVFIIDSPLTGLPASFDHDKIERIVFNLLSNAFKFTNEGGEIKLNMSVKESNDQDFSTLVISVSDTGIGIPPELLNNIFDRFFTGSNTISVLNQGSGIGLSITKEFMELHGGAITVESKLGQGTTFYLTLPVINTLESSLDEILVAEQQQDLARLANSSSEEFTTGKDVKTATILLVEDNEEFRYHLKDSLQPYYHIIEATNGKEGWQKALSNHPELIVSDINMPLMSGIELSHKIKFDKRTSHIPVILLTAISAEENQVKGLETGANDYLTKPFNFEILNVKVKNLLHNNRSVKDAYSKQIQIIAKEVETESNDEKLLSFIVQYIDEKMNDPELSVEDLSKHVGMSRGSLYHKLLELTGLTPIEYIRAIKLDRAAALLEKSDYNIAQIAYMTGFGTPSYFSRLFKAKFEVLPSEFINLKRIDNTSRFKSKI